jgi:hypothetical protein
MTELDIAPDVAITPAAEVQAAARDGRLRKLWAHRSSRIGMLILAFYA